MNKALKILFPLSFLVMPVIVLIFPTFKDVTIASVEFTTEFIILIEIALFYSRSRKDKFDWDTASIFISILFLFFAETIYNARLMKIIADNYDVLGDILYTGFATFLIIFLFNQLNIFQRKFSEWGWIFLAAFIIDSFLSYRFNLSPYYKAASAIPGKINNTIDMLIPYFATTHTLAWKINSTIYLVLTIFIFALIVPFMFRVSVRRTYWFFNFLLLLLIADIEIRYQDNFVNTFALSWAELAWCSAFIGLAWLIYFSRKKHDLFGMQPLVLAPFVSIRSLLTLAICGANILFLIGIIATERYFLNTAIDVSRVLFVLFIFWTIANEFSIWLANDLRHTLNDMFKSKEYLSADGIVYFKVEPVVEKNPIFEISQILESYNGLVEQTNKMMNSRIEAEKKKALIDIAEGVAHDIRSPLAAINTAVSNVTEIPEKRRIMLRNASKRINDIANNLLSQTRNNYTNTGEKNSDSIVAPELIFVVLDSIVSEKNYEYYKTKIQIQLNVSGQCYNCFADINVTSFKRVLSNLINNSIEASAHNASVIINLTSEANHVKISIEDNGCGIPPEILPKITEKGFSCNKKNGAGFGLSYAKQYIEQLNGKILIHSEVNVGTKITISLLRSNHPRWFCEKLSIKHDSLTVVLDDDPSIHDAWNERFSRIFNNKIAHFYKASDLSQHKIEELKSTLYLIDYELLADNKNGLDVIEELKLNNKAILVTSCFEDITVRQRCEKLGVKIIPKSYVPYIPIICILNNSCSNKLVFIDDDESMRTTWEFSAEEAGKNISTYSSFNEFINEINNYSKDTIIYIDSDLGDNIKGEIYAKDLFDKGFTEIHLATGHSLDQFGNMPWIKSIVGKEPPFLLSQENTI